MGAVEFQKFALRKLGQGLLNLSHLYYRQIEIFLAMGTLFNHAAVLSGA
jgi:hypothetical protein